MRIFGVQDGINGSVCLLEDGVLRYALQEERFSGVKEHIGFPYQATAKILTLAGIDISQVDEMALATDYVLRSTGVEGHTTTMGIRSVLKTSFRPFYGVWDDKVPRIRERAPELFSMFSKRRNVVRLANIRAKTGFNGPITIVDHHIAHAASGYYSAPWRDEPVLVLSKDAAGDGLCSTVSIGENGKLTRIARTFHADSLGYLYTAVTKYFGMKPHSHEYKVMGLAPHANPKAGQKSYEVFERYLGLAPNGLEFRRRIRPPLSSNYTLPLLTRGLHQHRFDNIAWGIQKLTEDLMTSWVRNAVIKTGIHKVAAGGGVFMNVKANKLIREMDGLVDGFFPMPSAGDESTSIGAAQWLYAERMREQGSESRIEPLGPLTLGDEPTEREIEDAMDEATAMAGQFGDRMTGYYGQEFDQSFDAQHSSHVDDLAADLILKGEIVARCRGPMEFGARALGNRSILCDATDLKVVRTINTAIKSRDFWMPFAPVIIEARVDELLKRPTYEPYMTMAFDTKEAGRHCLLAAMHQADLTVRPQILRESWNPDYYGILHAYEMETGRGGMLNTSFNLHGEPNVRDAKQAMRTFLNSGLKYMVLGDYLLSKKD